MAFMGTTREDWPGTLYGEGSGALRHWQLSGVEVGWWVMTGNGPWEMTEHGSRSLAEDVNGKESGTGITAQRLARGTEEKEMGHYLRNDWRWEWRH